LKSNHASSQGERRKTRKDESTKEAITMGKQHFKEINPGTQVQSRKKMGISLRI